MRESDRDDQESKCNADTDVKQDAFGPSPRVEDAAFLTKNTAQAGAARLHQNQNDQAAGKDQFRDS